MWDMNQGYPWMKLPEMTDFSKGRSAGLQNAMAGLTGMGMKKLQQRDMNNRADRMMHPQGPESTPTELSPMQPTMRPMMPEGGVSDLMMPRKKLGDLADALAGLGGLA